MHEAEKSSYESLLAKYISVWLWSVLFASMAGVGYTFIGYRPFEGRIPAAVILSSILFGIGALAALASLLALYRALSNYLIPRFLLKEERDPLPFALSLRRAFLMFIVAVVTRVILALVDTIVANVGMF